MTASFFDLVPYGILDAIPEHRDVPVVKTAVLLDPCAACVFLPPFVVEGHLLVASGRIPKAEFDELARRGDVTLIGGEEPTRPAHPDSCYLFPTPSGSPQYVPVVHAARVISEFCDHKMAEGGRKRAEGETEDALALYALAAAASGAPRCYESMLELPMSDRRRKRIEAALRQVLHPSPPPSEQS